MPILQAIAEGKTLQHRTLNDEWIDTSVSSIDYIVTYPDNYRIKPNPKYRPFANAKECWEEMQKHQPIGWVMLKDTESGYYMLKGIASQVVIGFNETPFSYKKVFEDYTFANGTPFGVKIEEE